MVLKDYFLYVKGLYISTICLILLLLYRLQCVHFIGLWDIFLILGRQIRSLTRQIFWVVTKRNFSITEYSHSNILGIWIRECKMWIFIGKHRIFHIFLVILYKMMKEKKLVYRRWSVLKFSNRKPYYNTVLFKNINSYLVKIEFTKVFGICFLLYTLSFYWYLEHKTILNII